MQKLASVAVIGLGRIGLPSAFLAAEKVETVFGIDHDVEYIASLKNGAIPFLEKGLKARFEKTTLVFTTKLETAELYILALPTLGLSGRFETDVVEKVLQKIGEISSDTLVIIESTLPLGAMRKLGKTFPGSLVYCPERVAPGSVFHELSTIPRCIASYDIWALEKAKRFYHSIAIETFETSPQVAETVKLSENAFRDANIAFANRLSEICGQNDTDIQEVIKIANTHPRVNILKPGLGAGGACLAPSTQTLDSGPLFSAIRQVNERQILRVLETLQRRNITSVSLWGLSYKANCDDLRFSKSMDLKALLESNDIEVKVWDPVAKVGDFSASLESQAIVFGVPHQAFSDANLPNKVRAKSQIKYIVDFVNAIDIRVWNKEAFSCICG